MNETNYDQIDFSLILIHKYPDSKWTLNANDYEQLVWLSEDVKPKKADLEAKWLEVQEIMLAKKQAKLDVRIATQAKLEALGITAQEAALLLG